MSDVPLASVPENDQLAGPRARILDVTVDEYRADPCKVPSLSASIAKILVDPDKSPAHAHYAHPRLGGGEHASTKAMDRGTILHRLILGRGVDFDVLDFPDWRTNAAKAARDASRKARRTPILKHEAEDVYEGYVRIREKLHARGYVLDGRSELACEWQERVTTSDAYVTCRCMFDHVWLDRAAIIDLKKTESAGPISVQRAIGNYGYHIQYAAYTAAIRALVPELAGREEYTLICCELEPPYAVSEVPMSGEFRELGRRLWDRAVRTWHECMSTGEWPDFGKLYVEPTPWQLAAGGM